MGMLDDLLNPQNSAAVRQIAEQVGINEADTRNALQHLSPALSRGIERNIGAEGGPEGLLQALQTGNHGRYLDDPSQLSNAVDDGNGILGHIFGSKEVSRGIADHVSQQTGLGSDLIKQMLPLVASLVMGTLARNARGGGMLGDQAQPAGGGGLGGILGAVLGGQSAPAASGGLGGLLTSMLDSNRSGSAIDDILNMAGRGLR